jgi:hypothetical protein
MGRIKPRIVSDLMDIANRFADGEDACTKKGHDHQRMIEETYMEAKGGDPAIMITTVLIAK